MQKGSKKAKTNEGGKSAGWKADGGVMNGKRHLYGICVFMYADEPSWPGSRLVRVLVQALCWLVEAHTTTAVHQARVPKSSSPPIAVGQPNPCPVVAGVEVAAIESSQHPVRTKAGVQATGMTSVRGQGRGGSGVIAGDHFAAEIHLKSNSAGAALEEGPISVG